MLADEFHSLKTTIHFHLFKHISLLLRQLQIQIIFLLSFVHTVLSAAEKLTEAGAGIESKKHALSFA